MAKATTKKTSDKNGSAEPAAEAATAASDGPATIPPSQVTFDTANLKSSYCNVCNGSSTREEMVVNFGLNDSWDTGAGKLAVKLEHRIVMSPHAGKRLRDMLVRLVDEHETRYGPLGE
ncbi:DUF3467 domain-containing protein [Roseobacteraceae bacterium S113]